MPVGTIVQDDFSGGVNWVEDPSVLAENELADARNMIITTKKQLTQRDGFTQFNSTATGATDAVTALHQFKDAKGTYTPVIQAGGKHYVGSAGLPATGSLTEIYDDAASAKPAILDDMWDMLLSVNGANVPLVYAGVYADPITVLVTEDADVTFLDTTAKLRGLTPVGWSAIDFDKLSNGGAIYIASPFPIISGIRIEMQGTPVIELPNTASLAYWTGSAWTACSNIADGTALFVDPSYYSLDHTGNVTCTAATTVPQTLNGAHRYWFRLSWATNDMNPDDNPCTIERIYVMPTMQALPNMWDGRLTVPVGVKTSTDWDSTTVPVIDHTQYATDGVLSTSVTMGGLTSSAGLFIQGVKKFSGVRITMDRVAINVANVSFAAKFWDGNSWETLTIVDGTEVNTATLAQSGSITFTPPATWEKGKLTNDIDVSYQIVLIPDATLTATVSIAEIELMEYPETLKIHQVGMFHKNRVWLGNREDAPNYVFCSSEFLPTVWGGADATAIGIPSGKAITSMARFFNEIMIGTVDEIYILEGYSPETFGLLKVNTGGIGPINQKSCVSVGKYIYFAHSTGFYRFDGLGVVLISGNIDLLFDPNDSTNLIPVTRLAYIEGRYNRLHGTVEWTVSRGSAQATNNLVCVFSLDYETWMLHDYAAGALVRVFGASGQELLYHGGYVGKIYRDYNGTDDNGTAITSYLTTRGFNVNDLSGYLLMFQGVILHALTEASTSLVITHAVSGNTTFSALGTLALARSGFSYTWPELRVPIPGTALQLKLTNTTDDHGWDLMRIRIPFAPMRDRMVQ